jgi:hypothetical protein
LEHGFDDFPYIGNVIIPTDEVIFFRGVETTNQFVIVQHQVVEADGPMTQMDS